ncbi:MAG TPA: tetratricopeptide repeat protein [Anaerolineaceae bacterium]|nr:tetratricopeptide repeat protein [Anaerolineaceae bacterium]
MQLTGRKPTFRKIKPRTNFYRALAMVCLIVAGIMLVQGVHAGTVKPLFSPTATPTRTFNSLEQEGDTYFKLGKLDCQEGRRDCAIGVYQVATELDPQNAELWARLARIQTYSSNLLTTNEDKYRRRLEAQKSAQKALGLAADNSYVNAINAFVLDWLASIDLEEITPEMKVAWLNQAEKYALQATTLDPNNASALAFYAEILIDQQKWGRAQQFIQLAMARENPVDPQMDVHRVYGYVLENNGDYAASITEYKRAAELNPNLTFLYLDIGNKYRYLKNYDLALSWFEKATVINTNLGIKDPLPYLAIANTYAQHGDFFAAVLNVRKALDLNPTTPQVYAQLGEVYYKSRNYEGSIPALQCALEGCSAQQSCQVRQCNEQTDPQIEITGMALNNSTVRFYVYYGSVLAGLYKPSRPQYCTKAEEIFTRLHKQYGDDPTVMSIVKSGEEICANAVGGGTAAPEASPTLKPDGTQKPPSLSTPTLEPTLPPYHP